MAGTKEIKRRIKSVKNTKKITKAMELVAASKMKRAVQSTLASRAYAEYSWNILLSVSRVTQENMHPLFSEREVKKVLLILISSNRGLCGAYNAQVVKRTLVYLKSQHEKAHIDIVTIGKKGDVAMRRIGADIVATFTDLPDTVSLSDIAPISQFIQNEFIKGVYDRVLVSYTDFVSALTQKANIRQVLPISQESVKEFIKTLGENTDAPSMVENAEEYVFDGDKDKILPLLAEKISRMQIYQMLLESNASEQSARMLAMKNASDAAGDMIDDLTLAFNKARQAGITQEISEISAGMASLT